MGIPAIGVFCAAPAESLNAGKPMVPGNPLLNPEPQHLPLLIHGLSLHESILHQMSATFHSVRKLVKERDLRVSSHGYDELAEDGIFVRDIVASVETGQVVEDYPEFGKGPCVLVLQRDADGEPVHVEWGIPKGHSRSAVLVTAYRPDPSRWISDFLGRK